MNEDFPEHFEGVFKILVCGPRDWQDKALVYGVLDSYKEVVEKRNLQLVIVNGGAKGADTFARMWAAENGVTEKRYPAQWERYGKSAGPKRNVEMLVQEQPSLVIGFAEGFILSKCTGDMINRARKGGFKTTVYTPDCTIIYRS